MRSLDQRGPAEMCFLVSRAHRNNARVSRPPRKTLRQQDLVELTVMQTQCRVSGGYYVQRGASSNLPGLKPQMPLRI